MDDPQSKLILIKTHHRVMELHSEIIELFENKNDTTLSEIHSLFLYAIGKGVLIGSKLSTEIIVSESKQDNYNLN